LAVAGVVGVGADFVLRCGVIGHAAEGVIGVNVVVAIGIDLGEELAAEVVGPGGGEVPRVLESQFLAGLVPVGVGDGLVFGIGGADLTREGIEGGGVLASVRQGGGDEVAALVVAVGGSVVAKVFQGCSGLFPEGASKVLIICVSRNLLCSKPAPGNR
jgi:hypothetical protein